MLTTNDLISLVRNALPESERDETVFIDRDGSTPEIPTLSEEPLASFFRELGNTVPSDFECALAISPTEVVFHSRYGSFDLNLPLPEEAQPLEIIRDMDWEGIRGHLEKEALMSRLSYASASTKVLQKHRRDDVIPWVKDVRKDTLRVHALVFDPNPEYDEELDEEEDKGPRLDSLSFPNLTVFLEEMEEMMQASKLIVAVVSEGKPWSAERIDRLKRDIANRLMGS